MNSKLCAACFSEPERSRFVEEIADNVGAECTVRLGESEAGRGAASTLLRRLLKITASASPRLRGED
jgi:hypothetical protein